jgi:hypothetical protein
VRLVAWSGTPLEAREQLAEQRGEPLSLRCVESGHQLAAVGQMVVDAGLEQGASLRGQLEQRLPLIVCAALAGDQTHALESVEAHADGAGGESELAAQPALRQARLADPYQRGQDREVAGAHAVAAENGIEPRLQLAGESEHAGDDGNRRDVELGAGRGPTADDSLDRVPGIERPIGTSGRHGATEYSLNSNHLRRLARWEEWMSERTAMPPTREIYDAFQRIEFDRWDAVIADDVLINSPAGRDLRGLATLKEFAAQFTRLAYRIDLVDEHLALDPAGNGRGFITFVLHWKHTEDFGGLTPTGREGTSVETMLLTVDRGQVTRIDIADNTLDLAIYEWERGWPVPHNVRPQPIIEGIDRRPPSSAATGSGAAQQQT